MYCRPLAGTIPFRVPIEICAARSCKVNSKGTGVAVVFVKTRQTCPSVSTGDIIQDIGKGGRANKENARLDSWTVGSRRPCRESSLLVRPVTSGNDEEDRLVVPLSRRVSTVSVGRLYRVTGFVFGSIEWPIATWNVPQDFLWPPLTSFPGLRPISIDSRGKIDFPQTFGRWKGRKFLLTGASKMPPRNNTLSTWKSISWLCPPPIRVYSSCLESRTIVTMTFSSWNGGAGVFNWRKRGWKWFF